jgi:hypothetical protein
MPVIGAGDDNLIADASRYVSNMGRLSAAKFYYNLD